MAANRTACLGALALLLAATAFLALAWITPGYSDADAYSAALNHLTAMGDPTIAADAMSRAFFDNLHRYQTHKWLFADIGYALSAWGGVGLLLSATTLRSGWGGLLRTRRGAAPLVLMSLIFCALLWLGLVASAVQDFQRGQLPYWADSLGIPFHGATITTVIAAPLVAVLAAWPRLLRPASSATILMFTRPPHWQALLATLLYAPPIVIGGLLIACAFEAGGWALSVAGFLLTWLMLNARVMVMG